jgi:hypothetical protein
MSLLVRLPDIDLEYLRIYPKLCGRARNRAYFVHFYVLQGLFEIPLVPRRDGTPCTRDEE